MGAPHRDHLGDVTKLKGAYFTAVGYSMAEVEALSERSKDCWRELQVPLGITSKRGLLAVPCPALEADRPAEGNPPARREAGGRRPGAARGGGLAYREADAAAWPCGA